MGRQGPCFHCGIEDSLIWRCGPAQKPVLCNACGSRWKIKGNLNGYFPKHKNIKRSKRKKLPLDKKPAIPVIVPNHKESNPEGKVVKFQNCSASSKDGVNSSRSECMVLSLTDCTQMESIAGTDSFQELEWKLNIPKKRRSYRRILTPIERFHRQLIRILHEQKLSQINEEYPLSFTNNNWMMSKNETRAGAVLHYPPLDHN